MYFSNEYTQYSYSHGNAAGDGRAAEDCKCGGGGWMLSEIDVWDKCPDHHEGQRHPEDRD